MSKRIRKKRLKRALNALIALRNQYEAAEELVFREMLQDVEDAYGESCEAFFAAYRRYTAVAAFLALRNPPPRFLAKYRHYPSFHQPPHS